jgi:hypothetical protein
VADIGDSSGDRAARMLGQWMLGAMSMWQESSLLPAANSSCGLALSPEEHCLKTLAADRPRRQRDGDRAGCWIGGDSDGGWQPACAVARR